MNTKALTNALIFATILQLAMVLSGHWIAYVKDSLFAIMGTAISIVGAVHYARAARPAWTWALLGGAIVGGLSALIGVVVSYALGDVPVETLMIGTLASTVAGAIAGAVARIFFKP